MADLLPPTNYSAVRAAIDVSLDMTTLSDSIIALDIYAGAAVRDVLAVDSVAESRTAPELSHAQAAAVFFCAARLASALPQITREENPVHSYQRQAVDLLARSAELRGLASAELDAYMDTSPTTSDMPTMFAAGCGGRGRW